MCGESRTHGSVRAVGGRYSTENEFLRSFSEKGLEKDEAEAPRKVTLSEYLSSPEFQRKRKIERERKVARLLRKRWRFVLCRNRTRSKASRDGNVVGKCGDFPKGFGFTVGFSSGSRYSEITIIRTTESLRYKRRISGCVFLG